MANFPADFKKTLTMLLCSAALAGCSGSGEPSSSQAGAPPPPADIVVVNHGLPSAEGAVPQDESAVLAPTALKADETTMAVAPPLQEGVPAPLEPQAEPITEIIIADQNAPEADRIAALEKEVMALRADYNAMMPAFNGLITTNQRIQALLSELEKQSGVKSSAAQAAPPKQASAIEAPKGGASVSDLRLGEHGDKTRLVLDISLLTAYDAKINEGQTTLVVTLPATGWSGKTSAAALRSPLIAGWSVQADEKGGSILEVELKKPAKILSTEGLKATEEGKPARIVIDVAAVPAS